MQARIILIAALSLLAVSSAFAQSSKRKRQRADDSELQSQPNSVNPDTPPQEPRQKKSKRSSFAPSISPEQEFSERMAEVEKTRRKNEKLMEKPQYSDPMYFGHKKPPKKHKPGKMKFCKICGIRH